MAISDFRINPCRRGKVITPDDVATFSPPIRFFAFGTIGAVKVTTADGDTFVIPSGTLAPGIAHSCFELTKIWATGTTATNFIGGYMNPNG